MHLPKFFSVVLLLTSWQSVTAQSLEVTSVRPHPPRQACPPTDVLPGGTVRAGCFTLDQLLREAFDLFPGQISGLQPWMRDKSWDIIAKTSGGAAISDEELYREVLKQVAETRFHEKLHSELRAVKGFALTVAKQGKLGPEIRPTSSQTHVFEVKHPGPSLVAKNVTMSEFAKWLKLPTGADREVKDRTFLSGGYDFTLKWTPLHDGQITDPAVSRDFPGIFEALREQLGLKVITARIQENFYTIDNAQLPDPN